MTMMRVTPKHTKVIALKYAQRKVVHTYIAMYNSRTKVLGDISKLGPKLTSAFQIQEMLAIRPILSLKMKK